MAAFFVYLANSAFVLIGHYGLTPRQYSLVYSVNALSFFGVAQLTGPLSRLVGLARTVRLAATGFTVMLGALLVLATAGVDHLAVMGAFLFVAFGCLGLMIPGTAVLALEAHGPIAGTASALMATVQLAIGALVMGVTGLLPKAIIAAWLSFFPVLVGMVSGLRTPDQMQLDLMRSWNASRPQALPSSVCQRSGSNASGLSQIRSCRCRCQGDSTICAPFATSRSRIFSGQAFSRTIIGTGG